MQRVGIEKIFSDHQLEVLKQMCYKTFKVTYWYGKAWHLQIDFYLN